MYKSIMGIFTTKKDKRPDFAVTEDVNKHQQQLGSKTDSDVHSSEITQTFKTDQATETKNGFEAIEQEVLESLPSAEKTRITTMRQWLSDNYKEAFETSYQQIIQKLYNKEIEIGTDSVKFLDAGKELYKQELQLPEGEDIVAETYTGFDGKNIQRREIRQKLLDDENHPSYQLVLDAITTEEQKGKQFATYDNTFGAILESFKGTIEQKIKAMQFVTGFVGGGIIDKEQQADGSRRFFASRRRKYDTTIWYKYNPDYEGSLLLSQDC